MTAVNSTGCSLVMLLSRLGLIQLRSQIPYIMNQSNCSKQFYIFHISVHIQMWHSVQNHLIPYLYTYLNNVVIFIYLSCISYVLRSIYLYLDLKHERIRYEYIKSEVCKYRPHIFCICISKTYRTYRICKTCIIQTYRYIYI